MDIYSFNRIITHSPEHYASLLCMNWVGVYWSYDTSWGVNVPY